MKFADFNTTKNSDGMICAVIQDADTLKVLMVGYMNEEAYNKTVETGKVTFFSRTKKRLWTKGETSGNYLLVKDMYIDCDGDTLLVKAEPIGPTCHRGTTSCFDTPESEGFVRHLQSVVQQRHRDMPEGSYTTKLFIKGVKKIAQKVGEEAVDTVIKATNGTDEEFVNEASDLLFHLMVLLSGKNLRIEDLVKELKARHKKPLD